MRNGTCPKCGSQQIYARQASGERNLISHDWSGESTLVIVDYVCGACGCLESYLDHSDLTLIQQSKEWQSVNNLKRQSEGICSKCGSTEVYARQAIGGRNLSASALGIIVIVDFVCGVCGFVESFVKPSDLPNIHKAWQPVNKPKRKNNDLAKRKTDETE